jgi:hypothetical protein
VTGLLAYILGMFVADALLRPRTSRPVNEARAVRR